MKTRFLSLITALLAAFALASCSNNDEGQAQHEYANEIDVNSELELGPQQPQRTFAPVIRQTALQYGRAGIIKDNNGPLFVYIRFPIADNFADGRISAWTHAVYQNARNETESLLEADSPAEGELNIQFDSYLLNDRFAGIVLQGMFINTALAHPIDIIQTFNLDLENEMFLDNSDILDFSQAEDILSLLSEKILEVCPDADGMLSDMDESWLTHIAIGDKGIYVILERAAFLPGYIGSLKILLPYDELEFALLLGKEDKAETIPEITQTPEATPGLIAPSVPPQSANIDPTRPMIALTFDDGPSRYTLRILELLARYGVRASFFVVGNMVEAKRDIVIQAAEMGNDIFGHSWDHSDLTRLSADAVRVQLLSTADIIESVTGIRPHSFRPPYGSVNDTVRNVSRELGFGIINWSVDTLDWQSRDADAVFNAVINDVANRAIILNHDLYESTADAMERIIPELISRGFQLVTISELLYYSGLTLEAGRVLYSGN